MNEVAKHYGEVAIAASTCAVCNEDIPTTSEAAALYDDATLAGIPLGALAASRGCGDPVARAELKPGEHVLDLGSGGGIDAIIAARLVGSEGFVYGLDMTPEMIDLARANAESAQATNVEFLHGVIEDIPLPDESVDVVISNCVINFSNNKQRVLEEARRVLKPGGRLVVSDIVSLRAIPEEAYDDLCKLVGCTNGMRSMREYQELLQVAGFALSHIDPKTVYTTDVLTEKASRKNRAEIYARIADTDIDGASGSAIVFAYK